MGRLYVSLLSQFAVPSAYYWEVSDGTCLSGVWQAQNGWQQRQPLAAQNEESSAPEPDQKAHLSSGGRQIGDAQIVCTVTADDEQKRRATGSKRGQSQDLTHCAASPAR